ncbi:hypothetical protein Hrubri_4375 [Herbaspirillum rubrisubalbicans M1]|nr:hypothetical protein Hrubri_4375 [Herbaspirillum rubrisubalbicans M1]
MSLHNPRGFMKTLEVVGSTTPPHDYMVRVVLHEPHNQSRDYDKLHADMAEKGFVKTMMQDGVKKMLPDAMYMKVAKPGNTVAIAKEVCEIAKKASGDKVPEVVVTEAVKVYSLNLVNDESTGTAGVKEDNKYLERAREIAIKQAVVIPPVK